MKVKFCNDNGANIHSKKEEIFDLQEDLNLTEEEWKDISEEEKEEMVKEWAFQYFEYWHEEVKE